MYKKHVLQTVKKKLIQIDEKGKESGKFCSNKLLFNLLCAFTLRSLKYILKYGYNAYKVSKLVCLNLKALEKINVHNK